MEGGHGWRAKRVSQEGKEGQEGWPGRQRGPGGWARKAGEKGERSHGERSHGERSHGERSHRFRAIGEAIDSAEQDQGGMRSEVTVGCEARWGEEVACVWGGGGGGAVRARWGGTHTFD